MKDQLLAKKAVDLDDASPQAKAAKVDAVPVATANGAVAGTAAAGAVTATAAALTPWSPRNCEPVATDPDADGEGDGYGSDVQVNNRKRQDQYWAWQQEDKKEDNKSKWSKAVDKEIKESEDEEEAKNKRARNSKSKQSKAEKVKKVKETWQNPDTKEIYDVDCPFFRQIDQYSTDPVTGAYRFYNATSNTWNGYAIDAEMKRLKAVDAAKKAAKEKAKVKQQAAAGTTLLEEPTTTSVEPSAAAAAEQQLRLQLPLATEEPQDDDKANANAFFVPPRYTSSP